MKIIEKTGEKLFRFNCNGKECKVWLEASADEFSFVRPGVVQYTCPKCGKTFEIKERQLKVVEEIQEVKKENPKKKA